MHRGDEARHSDRRGGRYQPFADRIAHVIPGTDDSSRAIRLYARGAADAILEGRSDVIQEIVQAAEEFVEVADDATA